MTVDPTWPVVVADPRIRFGRPRVGHTATEDVAGMIWAGEPVDVVCDEYELTRHQVLLACWFEATYGPPRRRRAWREWADQAHRTLGGWTKPFDLDAIPDPPAPVKAR